MVDDDKPRPEAAYRAPFDTDDRLAEMLVDVEQYAAHRDALTAASADPLSGEEDWPDMPLGSEVPEINRHLASQIFRMGAGSDDPGFDPLRDPGVIAGAIVAALEPKDELEGMLLAQIVTMHSLTMDTAARARGKSDLPIFREYMNQTNKASRTFVSLVEALNKHRGKGGQQRVTVEHVHIDNRRQTMVAPAASASPQMVVHVPDDAVTFDLMMVEHAPAAGGGGGYKDGAEE